MMLKVVDFIVSLILLGNIGNAYSQDFKEHGPLVVVCGKCHGDDGNSMNSHWPNLAGQNAAYFIRQINAFRSGVRKHPDMETFAAELSDTGIKALAAYYSNLSPKKLGLGINYENSSFTMEKTVSTPASMPQNTRAQFIKRGEIIYTSCAACHGVDGEGIAPFPRLAGQQPGYLKLQLENYKTGAREGKIMKMIAFNLSKDDITGLALYLTMLFEKKSVDSKLSKNDDAIHF
jgi:cytochrome c553